MGHNYTTGDNVFQGDNGPDALGSTPLGATVTTEPEIPAGLHGSAYVQESVYNANFPASTSAGAYGFASAAEAAAVLDVVQKMRLYGLNKGFWNNDAP